MRGPKAAIETLYDSCSDSDSLAQLAEAAGLAPDVDFENADLQGLGVAGEDLTAFSFRGADLRESDLRKARLRRTALEGARLEGARLDGIVWVESVRVDRHIFGWGAAWSEMPEERVEQWVSQLSPVDGSHAMNRETTRAFARRLPFYDRVELLAFTDENWPDNHLVIYYLNDGGDLYRLNGTSPPIHEVNAQAPIRLSEDNVLDYLRFFCFMVRGEGGPFHVLESVDDPFVPDDVDETTRSVIEGTVRTASLEGMNEEGHYLLDAVVFYSNALFIGNFAVQPVGMVEMIDDEPIAADLPARVQAPIA